MYILTVKNSDGKIAFTKEFETEREATEWAMNREIEDEYNIYVIREQLNLNIEL